MAGCYNSLWGGGGGRTFLGSKLCSCPEIPHASPPPYADIIKDGIRITEVLLHHLIDIALHCTQQWLLTVQAFLLLALGFVVN